MRDQDGVPALENGWKLPVIAFLVVMIAGAAIRFYYADANSYWLDELYSVTVYGTAHDSIVGAMKRVTSSVQLPLYYFILYIWMAIVGDGEVATRSLSNLYIIGATVCLFLTIRKLYGPWLGVIVALVFTLMFTPTYYGMETRGYAQTIFLSSLSTLILPYALPRIAEKSWRLLVRDGWLYALLATNSALLMTHYYNVLFLAAQGLFLIVYLLYRSRSGAIDALLKSVAVGVTPLIILFVTWAPFMLVSYKKRASKYVLEGLPTDPLKMLSALVISPNFGTQYVYAIVIFLLVAVTAITIARLLKRADEQTLFTLWFLLAALTPTLFAFVLFTISGHERYSSRYFSFSVGPLAVLIVLGIHEILTMLGRTLHLAKPALTLVLTAVIGTLLAYPGGLHALQKPKQDWRGIAAAIVRRIEQEPDKTFVVYETTFKKFPTLNYYLSRYSDDIRVGAIFQRHLEKGSGPVTFWPPGVDYVIVAFTHQKTPNFPKTLQALGSKMTLLERELDEMGRGYLLYAVPQKSEQRSAS